jgi:hypothetical protein
VSFLGLMFVFLVLIYFSSQLTILSNRVTEMAQYIAVKDVEGVPDKVDGPTEAVNSERTVR